MLVRTRGRAGNPGRLLGQHVGDGVQPGLVDVVQHELVDALLGLVTQQSAVDQRDAEAAAAENGQSGHARSVPATPGPEATSPARDREGPDWC